jgi:hypothetical protein
MRTVRATAEGHFRRAAALRQSSKKMKFLLKKWVAFERDFGSAAGVAEVQAVAKRYVDMASGGGGPENVFLVVNSSSADSLAVANAFAALRGIPPINVLMLPWQGSVEGVPIATFRDELLRPILQAIDHEAVERVVSEVRQVEAHDVARAHDLDRDALDVDVGHPRVELQRVVGRQTVVGDVQGRHGAPPRMTCGDDGVPHALTAQPSPSAFLRSLSRRPFFLSRR